MANKAIMQGEISNIRIFFYFSKWLLLFYYDMLDAYCYHFDIRLLRPVTGPSFECMKDELNDAS